MQLQFTQTPITCLQQLSRESRTREITQELRLPEDFPDVGKVLGAWGQVVIRGKQWRSGCAQVTGGVLAFVLYGPEDGSGPKSLQAWMPFSEDWDVPDTDQDGTLTVRSMLTGADARIASARKLILRVGVSLQAEILAPEQRQLCSVPELPEDVQVLRRTYPVQLPVEAGEKAFSLEESVSQPVPRLSKTIRYSLQPEIAERKVMGDKVVFRGSAAVHVLYEGEDGNIYPWDFELPFSQFGQLDQEHEEGARAEVVPALTALELEPDGEQMHLKAGLTCQYVICDRKMLELPQDAYSNLRTVTVQTEPLELPAVLDRQEQKVPAGARFSVQSSAAVDGAFYPGEPRVYRQEDRVQVQLTGTAELLYRDLQGQLQRESARWEDSKDLQAAGDVQVELFPEGPVSLGGMEVRQEFQMKLDTVDLQGLTQITALELGEPEPPKPDRPSLIIRTPGEQDLWELAKCCGSTVEAIRSANALEGEPLEQELLLIPVL